MMHTPRLRAPIVLVHGLLGFDEIRLGNRPARYCFPGIASRLAEAGNRVLTARLTPTGGVAQRAAELRDFLDLHSPAEPVHLLAHSLGGLDSRYAISTLGMADRVLSLTTIGTPHRGTPLADWAVNRFEKLLRPILRGLGWPYQAFYDLTRPSCAAFNAAVPDAPGVRYFSVAGRCEGAWLGLAWHWPHHYVRRAEGPNDGVVSLASASYGENTEIWEGDHLNLVNRPNYPACRRGLWTDRAGHYGGLIRRLADEGF